MGGKSKKNKPARSIDVASHQPRDNVEAVRQVYRRLRKGIDLKTLSKEAENLEKIKPSAITRLCRAKVDLSLAADTLRDKNLYELHSRTTSGVFREIRLKIVEVIKLTREGALDHNSLLCGRLCAKLALVLGYKLEDFELSRKHEELQDPNSEVVEQVCLCSAHFWRLASDVNESVHAACRTF